MWRCECGHENPPTRSVFCAKCGKARPGYYSGRVEQSADPRASAIAAEKK